MKKRNTIPLQLFAACLVGLLLGKFCFSTTKEGVELSLFNGKISKMQSIINIIDNRYVDVVDIDSINELIIPTLLSRLDPHSIYVPAQRLNESERRIRGQYYGVGIEFNVYNDTAMVLRIKPESPAAESTLKPGDRIVEVDGHNVTGKNAKSLVSDNLTGEYGREVVIGVKRYGIDSIYSAKVQFGVVPVPSAIASFMVDSLTGYLKLESFGDKSYREFCLKVLDLRMEGAKNLIIDLRENRGGRLEQAKNIASEILYIGDTIAYTIGRSNTVEELYTDTAHYGICRAMDVACLVDENSASAAEILAATIQDNDRGVIVGRRTFGKGLVQTPIMMMDGSQVRLTTQRYYMPSGRSLQKDYKDYDDDLFNRFKVGEFDSASAFHPKDTTIYYTRNHRTVYSKSGVMPDVFIPFSMTDNYTPLTDKIRQQNLTQRYVAERYNQMMCDSLQQFIHALFDDERTTFDDMMTYAQHNGISMDFRKDKKAIEDCYDEMMPLLKSDAYHLFGDEDISYKYYYNNDTVISAATQILNDKPLLYKTLNKKKTE
ncbi:MAG: PDZ domain-containing protein [Bacteroidales bacterium]|jgi:carboxyl-terminal processing protease|nr:PDZ domain-containing protein [Bacteroidales bacterium]